MSGEMHIILNKERINSLRTNRKTAYQFLDTRVGILLSEGVAGVQHNNNQITITSSKLNDIERFGHLYGANIHFSYCK